MHELAICGSVAEIALRRAAGRRVEAIHLRIGQLRQVVPDTLTYCWQLVTAETVLQGSRLEVESVPVLIECRGCHEATLLSDLPVFVCANCDGIEVDVITGEEFLITALDLAEV